MRIAVVVTLALLLGGLLPSHAQSPARPSAKPSREAAECPACQPQADALETHKQVMLELDRQISRAEARLSTLTNAIDRGEVRDTPERRQQLEALKSVVARMKGDASRLLARRGELETYLAECNEKQCRRAPDGPPPAVAVGGDYDFRRAIWAMFESDLRGEDIPPDLRAACPECLPVQQRYDDLRQQVAEAGKEADRAWDEEEKAFDDYVKADVAAVAPQKAADEFARINRERSTDLDLRAEDAVLKKNLALRKWDEARKAARDARSEFDRLSRDKWATLNELAACNRRMCTGDVQVGRVIGVTGNNPFEPSDPTKGGGVQQPPPQPASPGTLQFSTSSYGGTEGGTVLVTVTRAGGSKGAVAVFYATSPGTAGDGDFTAASGTLAWQDGDTTPKSFSIALTDDSIVEPAETFTVALTAPAGGAALGSPATATITITDKGAPQPPGTLQFSSASYSVMENAGSLTVTVNRTGGSAGTVTVQYATAGLSAISDQDFRATNGTLSFGPGETSRTFTVSIINDSVAEIDEFFNIALSGPTGGATLGNPSLTRVTIVDDEPSTPVGPCGAQGNAWTPNAGQYSCSGSCSPNPSPRLSVSGDIVTATNFHGAPAPTTFQGCGPTLNSRETNLTYFSAPIHRATITRSGDTAFSANITATTNAMCAFSCTRTGP